MNNIERCAFCGLKLQYRKYVDENICTNVLCEQYLSKFYYLNPLVKDDELASRTLDIKIVKGSHGNKLLVVKFNPSRHFNSTSNEWCPTIDELNHIIYWINRLMEERGEKTWTRWNKGGS